MSDMEGATEDSEDISKVIAVIEGKDLEWRFTVNEFLGKQYLHLRKYYLSFDEGYLPSKEGACLPCTLETTTNLFDALCGLLSESEALTSIVQNSKDERLVAKLK